MSRSRDVPAARGTYRQLYPHVERAVIGPLERGERLTVHGSEVRAAFIEALNGKASVDDHAERLIEELIAEGVLLRDPIAAPTPSQAAFTGLQFSKHPGWGPGTREHFHFRLATPPVVTSENQEINMKAATATKTTSKSKKENAIVHARNAGGKRASAEWKALVKKVRDGVLAADLDVLHRGELLVEAQLLREASAANLANKPERTRDNDFVKAVVPLLPAHHCGSRTVRRWMYIARMIKVDPENAAAIKECHELVANQRQLEKLANESNPEHRRIGIAAFVSDPGNERGDRAKAMDTAMARARRKAFAARVLADEALQREIIEGAMQPDEPKDLTPAVLRVLDSALKAALKAAELPIDAAKDYMIELRNKSGAVVYATGAAS